MSIKNTLSTKWKIRIGKQLFIVGAAFIFLGLLFLFSGQTEILKIIPINSDAFLVGGAKVNSYFVLCFLAFVGAVAFGTLYFKSKRKI